MKILVLGATGGTGKAIVKEAQTAGHEVVALVRSKEKAAALAPAQLLVGDARDEKTLEAALHGVDAVISSLGTPMSPFKEVTLLSTATQSLVRAMRGNGVRRLIVITGMGAGDSKGHGGFLYDRLFNPLMLRKVYEDKDRQEDVVRASDRDWTLVRPSVLNDKPPRGNIQVLTDLSNFHGGEIARTDVAKFVVSEVTQNRYLRKAPLISW
jgi:putative NADH-flavin reductase